MEELTSEQVSFAKNCMIEWIQIAHKEGYFDFLERVNGKEGMSILYNEIWHSALLERLLHGKDALPQPPPRAFSYPWYFLLEHGSDTVTDIGFWKDGTVAINQGSYLIEEKISDNEYILRYGNDIGKRDRKFRLTKGEQAWQLTLINQ